MNPEQKELSEYLGADGFYPNRIIGEGSWDDVFKQAFFRDDGTPVPFAFQRYFFGGLDSSMVVVPTKEDAVCVLQKLQNTRSNKGNVWWEIDTVAEKQRLVQQYIQKTKEVEVLRENLRVAEEELHYLK